MSAATGVAVKAKHASARFMPPGGAWAHFVAKKVGEKKSACGCQLLVRRDRGRRKRRQFTAARAATIDVTVGALDGIVREQPVDVRGQRLGIETFVAFGA
ncbi:MAG: hypothetical protein M4D80_16630 [Myxococcota bacterium]|nr:hypothetical protein [Myxococcota bacterium]